MRIFKHLRSDWFRYGFETLAVIVGILAAFALENWRLTISNIIRKLPGYLNLAGSGKNILMTPGNSSLFL